MNCKKCSYLYLQQFDKLWLDYLKISTFSLKKSLHNNYSENWKILYYTYKILRKRFQLKEKGFIYLFSLFSKQNFEIKKKKVHNWIENIQNLFKDVSKYKKDPTKLIK